MGLHEFSWKGLNLLVYGETPQLPALIGECVADVAPAVRKRLHCFEVYQDALNFCKSKKDVGFILLLDNCKGLPLQDVFRELCRPFENRGLSAFGVLIHAHSETLSGLKCMASNEKILAYLPVEDFLVPERARLMLDQLWVMFCRKFEEFLLPQPLQETLLALASEFAPPELIQLTERLSTLFCGRLNISWMDWMAIRWAPIVRVLEQNSSLALTPHKAVRQLVQAVEFSGESSSFALDPHQELPGRVHAWVHHLAAKSINNHLEEELTVIEKSCHSGSLELVHQTVKLRDEILYLAQKLKQE